MADDKIIQSVELQGAEQVQKDFKATGDAGEQAFDKMGAAAEKTNFDKFADNVKQIAEAAQQLTRHAQEVSGALTKQAEATDKVAQSSDQAAGSISKFGSSLASVAVTVGTAVIALAGLKLSIDSIRDAMNEVKSVGELADKAGIDRGDFQKLQFVFEQLGLSTAEARAKIQEFADEADKAAAKVEKLSGGAQALIKSTQQAGVSFSNSAGGMDAFRSRLAATAQSASNGLIPLDKLSELIKKFQGETDPQKLVEYANQLSNLAQQGKAVATALGQAGQSGGFGKVINIPQIIQAKNEVTNLKEAYAAFLKEVSPENFERVVGFLQQITDEEKRAEEAASLLGDEMGGNLVRMLDKLKESGKGGANPIKDLLKDFERLRLESSENAQIIAEEFNRAMARLSAATKKGREELSLLFAPAITAGVNTFTTALRANKGVLSELIAFVTNTATGVIQGFVDLLSGGESKGAASKEQKAAWVENARKAFVAFGAAVGTVFTNVIVPAVTGIFKLFEKLGETISQALGGSVSGSEVGVVAVITALLGPVNALISAFAILFGLNEAGFQKVAAFLSRFGIDLNKIREEVIKFKDDFIAAFQGKEVDNEWAKDLVAILKALPAAIVGVIAAFFAFRRALIPVATLLTNLFVKKGGKPITADAILLGSVIGEVSGAFTVLRGTLSTIAIAFATVGSAMFALYRTGLLVGQVIGALVFVFGGPTAAAILFAGAALLIVTNWEKAKELLKTVGIDIDKITASVDAFFARNFGGFKPFEEMGKTLKRVDGDWKAFRADVENFGIIEAIKKDLDKSLGKGNIFAQLFKDVDDFKKDLETKGLGEAILNDLKKTFAPEEVRVIFNSLIEFFKPGGELDQMVVGVFNSAIASIGRGLDAIIEAARRKIIALLNLIPGVNIKADPQELAPNDRVKQGFEETGRVIDETKGKLQQLQQKLNELKGPKQLETDVEAARQEVTELEEEIGVLNTELSGARRQRGGAGGAPDWLTEQFGDPKMFTEQLGSVGTKAGELNSTVSRGAAAWKQATDSLAPYVQGQTTATEATKNLVENIKGAGMSYNQIIDSTKTYVQGQTVATDETKKFLESIKIAGMSYDQIVASTKNYKQELNPVVEAAKAWETFILGAATKTGEVTTTTTAAATSVTTVKDKWEEVNQAISKALAAARELSTIKAPGQPTTPGNEINRPPASPISFTPGEGQGGGALVEQFKSATEMLEQLASTALQLIKSLANETTSSISTAIIALQPAIDAISSGIDVAIQNATLSVNNFIIQLSNVANAILQAFSTGPVFAFQSAVDAANGSVQSLISSLQSAIAAANELAAALARANAERASGGGSGGEGKQHGGTIHGPGGIDRVPIRATAGEFMMRLRAVRKYGVAFMQAINDGRYEPPGFAAGGMIDVMRGGMSSGPRLSPAIIGGSGSADNWGRVTLDIPGFGVIPVKMKSTTVRDVRDAAVRNRQNSISRTS